MNGDTPAPARVRMRGQERREQLIRVARSVFAERGYEAASVEEIAERAGVSKPVVYEHFAGKEGLHAVVVDGEVQELLTRIIGAFDAPHPRQALEQVADAILAYIEEQADGFRILVRDAPVGSATGTLPSVIGDIAAKAESLLAREFTARGYDPESAPLYARALVGMVALVGEWWLEVGAPDRREVADHLINLAWNGLKDLDRQPSRRSQATPADGRAGRGSPPPRMTADPGRSGA